MPLIPTANSFNRNMVLSISHGGVKYIIDKVTKHFQGQHSIAAEVEDLRKKVLNRKETTMNPDLL